jgi:putative peptidoglycan lipid II flippase
LILEVISQTREKLKYYASTVSVLTAINLLLAVLALIKDMLFASYMGTSAAADALLTAFFIPDTIGNSLISATLAISCIPLFSRFYARGEYTKLYRYILKINIYFLFTTGFITIIIFLFRNNIINVIGKGFSGDTRFISAELLIILLPTIPLFSILSIGIAGNQVFGKFAINSFSTVLFNLFFLIGIILCIIFKIPKDTGSFIISFFILISIVSMVLMVYTYLFISFRKRDISFLLKTSLKELTLWDENITFLAKAFIPYSIILLLSQTTLYIERNIASEFGMGSIAALNYGYRLSQFPLIVFVGAIRTVTYPMMSKAIAIKDFGELKSVFYRTIKYTLLVIVPASILLIAFRKSIITILFLRGAFDSNSLEITSMIVLGYSFAIIGQSITLICLNFFLALGETTKVLWIFFFSTALNAVADYYLVENIGVLGLGLGAFYAATFNALLLFYLFKIRISRVS